MVSTVSGKVAAGSTGSAATAGGGSTRPDCRRDCQLAAGTTGQWRVVSPGIELQVHPAACHSPHQLSRSAEQGKRNQLHDGADTGSCGGNSGLLGSGRLD
jgi:hypothetical protein